MREAVYDDLLPAQRHRLHVAAAGAIEADEAIIDPRANSFRSDTRR